MRNLDELPLIRLSAFICASLCVNRVKAAIFV
jgi:hypothetical protein